MNKRTLLAGHSAGPRAEETRRIFEARAAALEGKAAAGNHAASDEAAQLRIRMRNPAPTAPTRRDELRRTQNVLES